MIRPALTLAALLTLAAIAGCAAGWPTPSGLDGSALRYSGDRT